jgi:hypothetical protein
MLVLSTEPDRKNTMNERVLRRISGIIDWWAQSAIRSVACALGRVFHSVMDRRY